ncbi:MAG: hypothetical protein OHK0017_05400 [Patescibacteria group bacterium]
MSKLKLSRKQIITGVIGVIFLALIIVGSWLVYKTVNPANSNQTEVPTTFTPAEDDLSSVEITIERQPCFGYCPVYSVTINGSGEVIYKGTANVKVTGEQKSQISKEEVKKLVEEFKKADYFNLKDEYTANVSDVPTTITSLKLNGKSKRIIDYYNAPESLKALESKIDETVNVQQWTKK